MTQRQRILLGAAVLFLAAGAPVLYSSNRQTTLRNFRVVEDGVLYRSGQLTPAVFERVLREHRIRTVVSLRTNRTPNAPPPDAWEEDVCAARGVRYVRIVPRVWSADEKGGIPAEEGVREFLAVMDDPANHPVLVHCFAGVHRTGTMCALFRMEYHRWGVEPTIAEMGVCGYNIDEMHPDVNAYLRSYLPRWKRAAAP